jgi:hypothetical protein
LFSVRRVGEGAATNSTRHCHQPSRKGTFAPLPLQVCRRQHDIRIGSVAAAAALFLYLKATSAWWVRLMYGSNFKIWTRVLLVRKQIDGYCTIPQNIISITKENPDGFFFAGSLH